ncbi:GMC oxidoreductase [Gonapodya prolifera JEL478]|uniref:GMC oxidoreductase n=1 Tax=Gonapodya prolifera (strain JEL478) TaxID=1344416 RepID=A0A139AZU3_GONPJ|nr:GMC oxidoreductase [Gonapodya prolifera JEL478]|eukprot:KXS22261.1 GMC oxidoreductase [Gonapodya prolifera JEL478]
MNWPRGYVVGGSSVLNAILYVRCSPKDYDEWESVHGCTGWSHKDVLPYFMRSEGMTPRKVDSTVDPKYHNFDGPYRVTELGPEHVNPFAVDFVESAVNHGLKRNPDYNAAEQQGVFHPHISTDRGVRCDTFTAYIKNTKADQRPNLVVQANTFVQKVVFDGNKKATGVIVRRGKSLDEARKAPEEFIRCKREVVLSGGAIGSPWILMNSGVGPKQHLAEVGIPCIEDLPVGQNLKDHLYTCVLYKTKDGEHDQKPVGLAEYIAGIEQHDKDGTGAISTALLEALAFWSSGVEPKTRTDLEIHFSASFAGNNPFFLAGTGLKSWDPENQIPYGVSPLPTLCNPKSVGEIKLASNDPFEHPIIDPRYLTHEDDWEILRRGIRTAREIMKKDPIASKVVGEVRLPTVDEKVDMESDEYINAIIRDTSTTVYHPTTTCRMGPDGDANSVVDLHLRVRGVKGLRVIDASIMPELVSGNTNAPSIMIGEKGAAHILEDHPDLYAH